MTKNAPALAVKTIAALAAATATLSAPLLSAPAWASPTTPTVPQPVPPVQHPTEVQNPAPINTHAPAPPPAQHTATQAPTTPPPVQHTTAATPPPHSATTEPSAPKSSPTPTVQPSQPSATAPAPSHSPPASAPTRTSEPGITTRPGASPSVSPTWRTTGPSGHQSVVIPRGGTSTTVPIAAPPKRIPASHEAIEAARLAPAALIDPKQPPPPPAKVNFNDQIQTAIRENVNHDQGVYRPQHWDYVDYDEYHRPHFFNPMPSDVSFQYFYNGAYQTVWVPAGGCVLLNMDAPGVFPFTVAAAALISVGSFLGGAWIPPEDWVGPPPSDWQPWAPVTYQAVPVDFANAGQTVLVDEVTQVGHDDSLPVGQRDIVQLPDGTLGRGEIQPSPEGGPPQITVQQTQQMPGVSPWNNGRDWINTAVSKPAAPPNNHLPWIIGGLAAVLALLGGAAAWVWKHPHGTQAVAAANAPTETFNPAPSTSWMHDGADSAPSTGQAWSETDL